MPQFLKVIVLWLMGFLSMYFMVVPAQTITYLTKKFEARELTSMSQVWPIVLKFLVAAVGMAILAMLVGILKKNIVQQNMGKRTMSLLPRLLRASPDFFRRFRPQEISQRLFMDLQTVENFRFQQFNTLPLALLSLSYFSVILLFGQTVDTPIIGRFVEIDKQTQGNLFFGLLVLVLLPLRSFFLLFDQRIQKLARAMARAREELSSTTGETFDGIGEIRGHSAFDYAVARMHQKIDQVGSATLGIDRLSAALTGIGPTISATIKGLFYIVGAGLCLGDVPLPFGGIVIPKIDSWGTYMGFVTLAEPVEAEFSKIVGSVFDWRMARESIRRLSELESEPAFFKEESGKQAFDGRQDAIIVKDLVYEIAEGVKPLQNLSLDIKPGEHVAFVGPSGCGKSTTISMLVRDALMTAGTLRFGEKSIDSIDIRSAAAEIGYVRQTPVIWNLTIRDNLLLALRRPVSGTSDPLELDLRPLGPNRTLKDLEARLVEVVKQVGLRDDVIMKSFGLPFPAKFSAFRIATSLGSIRESITKRLGDKLPELVCPFDKQVFLVEGTLFENLLFGVLPENIKTDPEKLERMGAIEKLVPWLDTKGFMKDILRMAVRILPTHPKFGQRLKFQCPQLFGVLGELNPENRAAIKALRDNAELPTFMDLALELRGRELVDRNLLQVDFASRFAACRAEVEGLLEGMTPSLLRFDRASPIDGLTLQEVLLNGRVNSRAFGAGKLVDECLRKAVAEAGFEDELVHLGLEANAAVPGALSVGQKMKVTIARALLKNPSILLLDEATSPLDPASKDLVMKMLREECKGRTVIAILHDIHATREFDRIVVFDRGRVVQEGTYSELVARPGLFQELVARAPGSADLSPGKVPGPVPQAIPPAVPPSQGKRPTPPKQASGPVGEFEEVQRALSLSPLFADLKDAALSGFAAVGKLVDCKAGQILFKRGEQGEEFYVILDGEIEFFAGKGSDGAAVDVLGSGKLFGELALLGNVPRTLGARARTASKLCRFGREELYQLLSQNPELSIGLLETISRRLAEARDRQYSSFEFEQK